MLPPKTRVLAAAAAGRAWCVEELFAQGCPIEAKNVSAGCILLAVSEGCVTRRLPLLDSARLPVGLPPFPAVCQLRPSRIDIRGDHVRRLDRSSYETAVQSHAMPGRGGMLLGPSSCRGLHTFRKS